MTALLKLVISYCALTVYASADKPFFEKGKSGFERMSSATSMALWRQGKTGNMTEPIPEGLAPKVQAFGYNAIAETEDGYWGIILGLNFDLGLAYELPLYNQDEYLVWRAIAHGFLGGRQYVTIKLGYVRLHGFFDLWGAKATFFDNFMRYDIVNYKDFCDTAGWLIEIARF